jgi:hypothetical protein
MWDLWWAKWQYIRFFFFLSTFDSPVNSHSVNFSILINRRYIVAVLRASLNLKKIVSPNQHVVVMNFIAIVYILEKIQMFGCHILSFIFRQTQHFTNQLTHISLCITEFLVVKCRYMFQVMEPSSGDTSTNLYYWIMLSLWIHINLSLFFDHRYMHRLYFYSI